MLQNGGVMTAPADVVKDTTTQGFMKDVIEESKRQPVLVDFWAPWCGPCKQLTPVLEKAVKAAKGKVKLAKMNIDEHPAIPGQMGIQSIPAVIAFSNGQPVDGFMGALPESQVVAFLERLTKGKIGGEEQDLLKAADAALAGGDPAGSGRDLRPASAAGLRQCARARRARALLCRDRRHSSRPSRRSPWCRKPSERSAGRRRARRARSRRAGEVARPVDRAGSESRRQPARSPGALRSRRRAQRQGPARRGGRASARRSSRETANGTTTRRASSSCSSSKPGALPIRPPSTAASGCRRFCFRECVSGHGRCSAPPSS